MTGEVFWWALVEEDFCIGLGKERSVTYTPVKATLRLSGILGICPSLFCNFR